MARNDEEPAKRGRPAKNKQTAAWQVAILMEWVRLFAHQPYPSQAQKEAIAIQTDLKVRQVELWLANYRKRHWRVRVDESSSCHPRLL